MMNAITIRNLSDEASRALQALAAEHGTTAEKEAQRILQDALAVLPVDSIAKAPASVSGQDLITAFQALREKYPELDDVEFKRDQTPAIGISLE
jgi:plasmid stability protein